MTVEELLAQPEEQQGDWFNYSFPGGELRLHPHWRYIKRTGLTGRMAEAFWATRPPSSPAAEHQAVLSDLPGGARVVFWREVNA